MDIRSWRAGRDRRYNRLWWAVFLCGCCLVVAIVATTEEFNVLPWLILVALVGMILRRRRHFQAQTLSDAREDVQAKQAAEAEAKAALVAMTAEMKDSAQQLADANDALVALVAEVKKAQARQAGHSDDDPPKC